MKHSTCLNIHTLVVIFFSFSLSVNAQLKELEVKAIKKSSNIPVFVGYPDDAAIVISSNIENLKFDSNVEIKAQLGNPSLGDYRLILPPYRQTIIVSKEGYRQLRFTINISNSREVQFYEILEISNLAPLTSTETDRVKYKSLLEEIEPDLLAHYTFDGHLRDVTENKPNSRLNEANYSSDRNGVETNAIILDGDDDFIELPISHRGVGTISFWFKTNQFRSAFLLNNYVETLDEGGLSFILENGHLELRGINGWEHFGLRSKKSLNDNEWQFVTLTTRVGSHELYINGEIQGVLTEGILKGNVRFLINASRYKDGSISASSFQGVIDDIRFYNKPISKEYIEALYYE